MRISFIYPPYGMMINIANENLNAFVVPQKDMQSCFLSKHLSY